MTTRRMIGRTRPEWGFWSNMIFGWAALLDALVSILTLGFYCGGYQLTYASWRTMRRFQKLKKLAKK